MADAVPISGEGAVTVTDAVAVEVKLKLLVTDHVIVYVPPKAYEYVSETVPLGTDCIAEPSPQFIVSEVIVAFVPALRPLKEEVTESPVEVGKAPLKTADALPTTGFTGTITFIGIFTVLLVFEVVESVADSARLVAVLIPFIVDKSV